jgi:ferredoxin
MDRGAKCSLCLDCVRACPEDNIALLTQPPGADLAGFQSHRRSLDEASAIAAVLGVALFKRR